jgi:hypothetical protein
MDVLLRCVKDADKTAELVRVNEDAERALQEAQGTCIGRKLCISVNYLYFIIIALSLSPSRTVSFKELELTEQALDRELAASEDRHYAQERALLKRRAEAQASLDSLTRAKTDALSSAADAQDRMRTLELAIAKRERETAASQRAHTTQMEKVRAKCAALSEALEQYHGALLRGMNGDRGGAEE